MYPLLHEARLVCRPGTASDPQRILPFGKGTNPVKQVLAKNDSHSQEMAKAEFHVPYGPKPGKMSRPYKRQTKNNKRNKRKMSNQNRIGCEQIPVIVSIHIDPIAENH